MEYLLLLIVLLQSAFITYLLVNKRVEPLTEEHKEQLRKEKIEKDWQKLFNYNETIATRGYKE
jgi:cell division protein FtsL